MNYIITGGTGFIGTHLANLIKEQDENAQVWIWILWILKYISTDDTDGGPQADCFEERELWRIDRELKEMGPQADEVGEQQLSSIGQQLKENIFYCRYIAGNCCSRKRDGGLWSAIAINDQQLKEKKCISTDDTDEHGDLLAEQCLNCSDYLSADVRQMLYGFSSVSDLLNICGLYWSAGGLF